MGRKSIVSQLPESIINKLNKLILNNIPIDDIVTCLEKMDVNISRSSVGRYTKQHKEATERMREVIELTKAMGQEIDLDDSNSQHQGILNMLQALISRYTMKAMAGDDELSANDLQRLGRAIREAILSSDKLEDIKKKAQLEALEDMEKVAKKDGNKKPLEIVAELKKGYGFE